MLERKITEENSKFLIKTYRLNKLENNQFFKKKFVKKGVFSSMMEIIKNFFIQISQMIIALIDFDYEKALDEMKNKN
ncbi:hypothetical protein J9303_05495 [Bacillaceae bacterium Marseille-Q3522]|nr:hypothetical protein [Bacillaceae bacterium Marseille-Q3522]